MKFAFDSNGLKIPLIGGYIVIVLTGLIATMHILFNYRTTYKRYSYKERHRTAFYMTLMAFYIAIEPVLSTFAYGVLKNLIP